MATSHAGNVVPLPTAAPALVPPPPADEPKEYAIAQRLTPKLARSFCPVPSYLIRHAHRLKPHDGARGLNATEVLVLIHILDRKWDHRLPHPAITTIASAMGLSARTVRSAVKRLQDLKYLIRIPMPDGGPNRYDLTGLFMAIERLMDEDAAARDAAAASNAAGSAATPPTPSMPAPAQAAVAPPETAAGASGA